jgi:hypothetical protein
MTSQVRSVGSSLAIVVIAVILASRAAPAADVTSEPGVDAALEESRSFLSEDPGHSRRDVFVESFFRSRGTEHRARLDLSPLLIGITQFLRDRGIPLQTEHDREGDDAIGVSASFSVRRDLPSVRFEAGDPVESFGAFYAEGFRCAFVWPARVVSLRLEAGEDSELGYFAVAGTQWAHPKRPLALGLGIPMNLRDAEGDVGLILQFRMKLD